jgi:hypothetical protein
VETQDTKHLELPALADLAHSKDQAHPLTPQTQPIPTPLQVAQVRGELAGVRAAQQQQPAGGGGGRSLSLGGQLNYASLLHKR